MERNERREMERKKEERNKIWKKRGNDGGEMESKEKIKKGKEKEEGERKVIRKEAARGLSAGLRLLKTKKRRKIRKE